MFAKLLPSRRTWIKSSVLIIRVPKLFPPLLRIVKISFAASVEWNIIIPRKMRIHENSVVVVVILIFVVLVSNSLCVVCILQNNQVLRRLRKAIVDNLFTVYALTFYTISLFIMIRKRIQY